jgi:hypothetical protein
MWNLPDEQKLLLIDDGFADIFDYTPLLRGFGFHIYQYDDVERFRILYEEILKHTVEKTAVIVSGDHYVPHDIRQAFREIHLSIAALFPMLHAETVLRYPMDLDLISIAYEDCYEDLTLEKVTEDFIRDRVFSYETIQKYGEAALESLHQLCEKADGRKDWIEIARKKARLDYYACAANIPFDTGFIDEAFARFVELGYGYLSADIDLTFPPIITKTLSAIHETSRDKAALIVMDGMSLFDFEAIARHLDGIKFDYGCSFALIPTMTPISRQSLLSGKYPRELANPFSLADEEKEFFEAAAVLGYAKSQAQYLRGFEPEINPFAKVIAIIVNEIDDIVHGQHQGKNGMYADMKILGKSGKLQNLIKQLTNAGFRVYITADHGNTPCVGVGGFRTGVEVETRSKRMVVFKDFAELPAQILKYTTEYPAFYLDRNYRYLICKSGVSFNHKDSEVMTHGGMSIDEVIVPFIKIKETE